MVLDSVQDFYRVQVSNGDIGYIYIQELRSWQIGITESDEPEQYFYRGIQGGAKTTSFCKRIPFKIKGRTQYPKPYCKDAFHK